jgi:hypothetical protein
MFYIYERNFFEKAAIVETSDPAASGISMKTMPASKAV